MCGKRRPWSSPTRAQLQSHGAPAHPAHGRGQSVHDRLPVARGGRGVPVPGAHRVVLQIVQRHPEHGPQSSARNRSLEGSPGRTPSGHWEASSVVTEGSSSSAVAGGTSTLGEGAGHTLGAELIPVAWRISPSSTGLPAGVMGSLFNQAITVRVVRPTASAMAR